jgi:hypothetical protein
MCGAPTINDISRVVKKLSGKRLFSSLKIHQNYSLSSNKSSFETKNYFVFILTKKNKFWKISVFLNFLACFETWSDNFFFVIFSKVFIDLNEMKKKIIIRKKNLIFLKRWPVCPSKNQWKKHIFRSNLFKNKDFFKILKIDYDLNYLAKFVQQHFSKTHLDASERAKKKIFCDVTKG